MSDKNYAVVWGGGMKHYLRLDSADKEGWSITSKRTWVTREVAKLLLAVGRASAPGSKFQLMQKVAVPAKASVPEIWTRGKTRRVENMMAKSLKVADIYNLAATAHCVNLTDLTIFHVAVWCQNNLVLLEEDCDKCGQSAADCECNDA